MIVTTRFLRLESGIIRKLILMCLFFACAVPGKSQATSTQPKNNAIKFEVLSVRQLSDEEYRKRTVDNIGLDLTVRLRLSNQGDRGLYFLTTIESFTPLGYGVKRIGEDTIWVLGDKKTKQSPGVDFLTEFFSTSQWILIPPYSAIEWEDRDTTGNAGQKRAFTMFLKETENGIPSELISDFYAVPAEAK